MQVKTIKGTTTREITVALEQSMANGFKPTLAIVFITKTIFIKEIGTHAEEPTLENILTRSLSKARASLLTVYSTPSSKYPHKHFRNLYFRK